MILCIDPGLRGCGTAIFEGRGLVHSAYVQNTEHEGRGAKVWAAMAYAIQLYYQHSTLQVSKLLTEVLIETQIIRPSDKPYMWPDILELQGVAGAIAGRFAHCSLRSYLPSQWKGTVQGDAMTERIKGRLESSELFNVHSFKKGGLDHNTYDAIGIGLFHFGRLEKRRVIAR